MSRDTCALPSCDEEPLGEDAPAGVKRICCSEEHSIKYEHLAADAADRRREEEAERRREAQSERDIPERGGNPMRRL